MQESADPDHKSYPAVENLFTWPATEPALIGGRCDDCGTYFFPKFQTNHSPDCRNRNVKEVLLSRTGELISYTTINYPPPPPFVNPDPFVPFGVGLVKLKEGIAVLGILTDCPIEKIEMHIKVELVIDTLYIDENGDKALGWKFRPVKPLA